MKHRVFNLEELMNSTTYPIMFPKLFVGTESGNIERVMYIYKGLVISEYQGDLVKVDKYHSNSWNPISLLDVPALIVKNPKEIEALDEVVSHYESDPDSSDDPVKKLDGIPKMLDEKRLDLFILQHKDSIRILTVGMKESMGDTQGVYWEYEHGLTAKSEAVYETTSVWATPFVQVEWYDDTESTFECWVVDKEYKEEV